MTTNAILNGRTGNATLADFSDLLGYVVWHSIGDVRITEASVQALAQQAGITNAPSLGHPADAFRRATSASQVRDKHTKTRYLTRPVTDTADTIVREIVVERVDTKGKRLAHFSAVRLTYNKAGQVIDVADIAPATSHEHERARAMQLAGDACNRYTEFTTLLTGRDLTRFAMRCMGKLAYINLRPQGGVYFVPSSRLDAVEALITFFDSLTAYRAGEAPVIFSAAPVPNTARQRGQVAQGAVQTIGSEIDQAIAKIAELADDAGNIRESTVSNKAREAADLRKKSDEYRRMIGAEMGVLDARLELLDSALANLLDKHTAKSAPAAKPGRTRPAPRKVRKSA